VQRPRRAWEMFEAIRGGHTMEWLCSLLGLDPHSEAIQMMLDPSPPHSMRSRSTTGWSTANR